MVESSLGENMAEYLNAEIALKTIYDVDTAIKWIQSTFYYVRVKKNPTVILFITIALWVCKWIE